MLEFFEVESIGQLLPRVTEDIPDFYNYSEHERVALVMNWIFLCNPVQDRPKFLSSEVISLTFSDYSYTIFNRQLGKSEDLIVWKPESFIEKVTGEESYTFDSSTDDSLKPVFQYVSRNGKELLFNYDFMFFQYCLKDEGHSFFKLSDCKVPDLIAISMQTGIDITRMKVFDAFYTEAIRKEISLQNKVLDECNGDYMRVVSLVPELSKAVCIKQRVLLTKLLSNKFTIKVLLDYFEEQLTKYADGITLMLKENEKNRMSNFVNQEEKDTEYLFWMLSSLHRSNNYRPGDVTRKLNQFIKSMNGE